MYLAVLQIVFLDHDFPKLVVISVAIRARSSPLPDSALTFVLAGTSSPSPDISRRNQTCVIDEHPSHLGWNISRHGKRCENEVFAVVAWFTIEQSICGYSNTDETMLEPCTRGHRSVVANSGLTCDQAADVARACRQFQRLPMTSLLL